MAGSMPILVASCSAAPSAFGPGGTGRVNDVCTIPSPVVSPYGRMMPRSRPAAAPSPSGSPYGRTIVPSGMDRLHELQRRVVRVGGQLHHAVQALAAVRGALGDAERAVGD